MIRSQTPYPLGHAALKLVSRSEANINYMGRIPFCFYTTICSVLYFKVSLVYHFAYNTVTLFLFCCFWQGVKSLKENVRPHSPPLNPPLHKLLFLSSRETAKFRTQKPSWSQKSGNAMFWSGKSGHAKVLSRKYGHESGTSTREDRSKPLKNRSNLA